MENAMLMFNKKNTPFLDKRMCETSTDVNRYDFLVKQFEKQVATNANQSDLNKASCTSFKLCINASNRHFYSFGMEYYHGWWMAREVNRWGEFLALLPSRAKIEKRKQMVFSIRIERKTHSWLITEVCENLTDVNRKVLLFKKFENESNSQYHQSNDNKLNGFAFKHCSHAKHGQANSSILGFTHLCGWSRGVYGAEKVLHHSLGPSQMYIKIKL